MCCKITTFFAIGKAEIIGKAKKCVKNPSLRSFYPTYCCFCPTTKCGKYRNFVELKKQWKMQ